MSDLGFQFEAHCRQCRREGDKSGGGLPEVTCQLLTSEGKWNLPRDYPLVAPNYASARSQLAKQMGLGKKAARQTRRRKGDEVMLGVQRTFSTLRIPGARLQDSKVEKAIEK